MANENLEAEKVQLEDEEPTERNSHIAKATAEKAGAVYVQMDGAAAEVAEPAAASFVAWGLVRQEAEQ